MMCRKGLRNMNQNKKKNELERAKWIKYFDSIKAHLILNKLRGKHEPKSEENENGESPTTES